MWPSCLPVPAAAHAIFEAAKSRVYRLKQGGSQQQQQQRKRKVSGTGAGEAVADAPAKQGAAPQIEAVLEGMPKWDLLREVLAEVQAERRRLRQLAGDSGRAAGSGGAGRGAAAGGGDDVIVLEDDDGVAAERREQRGAADAAATAQQAADAPVLVVCQDTFTAGQVSRRTRAGGGSDRLWQGGEGLWPPGKVALLEGQHVPCHSMPSWCSSCSAAAWQGRHSHQCVCENRTPDKTAAACCARGSHVCPPRVPCPSCSFGRC